MIPFFRYRLTVNALSCWFTLALELLTTSSVCTRGLDDLTALTGVDAMTGLTLSGADAVIGLTLAGVDAPTGLTGVDAVTALSSARLSSGSTWMGARRRAL
jgi:hypothetical protein